MVSLHTAHTLEADDAEYAIAEILDQLQLESNQKKYSAGTIFCHTDFTNSGVAQAIAERMPFDVVGSTFVSAMTPDMDDHLMLVFNLFTSDDVEISALKIDNIAQPGSASEAYRNTFSAYTPSPGLIMSYFPMIIPRSIDSILDELDSVSGGAPVYGGLAADTASEYDLWQVLYNGEAARDMAVSLFFFGDVHPQFFTSNMTTKYVQTEKSVITKSEGNILMEVNDKPFIEYLKDNGFGENVTASEFGSTPLLIDFCDGTPPVPRFVSALTPEGHTIIAGEAPVGSLLSLGSIDYAHVIRVTEEVMKTAVSSGTKGLMLIHPCASNYLLMGAGVESQKEIIRRYIGNEYRYTVGYSGGEVCPVYDKSGKRVNRFHNYTFVLCIL